MKKGELRYPETYNDFVMDLLSELSLRQEGGTCFWLTLEGSQEHDIEVIGESQKIAFANFLIQRREKNIELLNKCLKITENQIQELSCMIEFVGIEEFLNNF